MSKPPVKYSYDPKTRTYSMDVTTLLRLMDPEGRSKLEKGLVESIGIAECFNNHVPKFPAVGGPTAAEKRLIELRKLVPEKP